MAKPTGTFDKVKYDDDFRRQNYDRFLVTVRKGDKAKLQSLASKNGMPLNRFIVETLSEALKIDISASKD